MLAPRLCTGLETGGADIKASKQPANRRRKRRDFKTRRLWTRAGGRSSLVCPIMLTCSAAARDSRSQRGCKCFDVRLSGSARRRSWADPAPPSPSLCIIWDAQWVRLRCRTPACLKLLLWNYRGRGFTLLLSAQTSPHSEDLSENGGPDRHHSTVGRLETADSLICISRHAISRNGLSCAASYFNSLNHCSRRRRSLPVCRYRTASTISNSRFKISQQAVEAQIV